MTIFERIMAGEIPGNFAYQDEQYIALHDVNSQAPVHILVIPRKVIATLNDLTESDKELVGGMFLVAKKVMNELGQTDYRTVFNCGASSQTVFHLHLHCLAGRAMTWPPG